MNFISDAKVDHGDDILLKNDILIETNPSISTIRCAERRISARYDDFILDDISAGLERYLLQTITQVTKLNIEEAIRECLYANTLLLPGDYDVYILDETQDGKLPIIIKFRIPEYLESELGELTFSVKLNLQNQRSYR